MSAEQRIHERNQNYQTLQVFSSLESTTSQHKRLRRSKLTTFTEKNRKSFMVKEFLMDISSFTSCYPQSDTLDLLQFFHPEAKLSFFSFLSAAPDSALKILNSLNNFVYANQFTILKLITPDTLFELLNYTSNKSAEIQYMGVTLVFNLSKCEGFHSFIFERACELLMGVVRVDDKLGMCYKVQIFFELINGNMLVGDQGMLQMCLCFCRFVAGTKVETGLDKELIDNELFAETFYAALIGITKCLDKVQVGKAMLGQMIYESQMFLRLTEILALENLQVQAIILSLELFNALLLNCSDDFNAIIAEKSNMNLLIKSCQNSNKDIKKTALKCLCNLTFGNDSQQTSVFQAFTGCIIYTINPQFQIIEEQVYLIYFLIKHCLSKFAEINDERIPHQILYLLLLYLSCYDVKCISIALAIIELLKINSQWIVGNYIISIQEALENCFYTAENPLLAERVQALLQTYF